MLSPAQRDGQSALRRAVQLISDRLPISREQATVALARARLGERPVDLAYLARQITRLGHPVPFRVLEIGGADIAVNPTHVTAAKGAWMIASRTVYHAGAATVSGVGHQLSVMSSMIVAVAFVERLLSAIPALEWLDRERGWFWLAGRPNLLVRDLRKIFAVTRRMTLPRLWETLTRARDTHPPPAPVLGRICAALPGARLAGQTVVVRASSRRPAPPFTAAERRMVELLERRGPLPVPEVTRLCEAGGLSPSAARHLLRRSPLLERLPDRTVALVGSN